MKSILVIPLMLFLIAFAKAQEVKSIEALELKKYIQSSHKPQIVNFWASWCAPCIEEMPYLQAISSRNADSIELVLVSPDFKNAFSEKLVAFINAKKLSGTQYRLDETDADYFLSTDRFILVRCNTRHLIY